MNSKSQTSDAAVSAEWPEARLQRFSKAKCSVALSSRDASEIRGSALLAAGGSDEITVRWAAEYGRGSPQLRITAIEDPAAGAGDILNRRLAARLLPVIAPDVEACLQKVSADFAGEKELRFIEALIPAGREQTRKLIREAVRQGVNFNAFVPAEFPDDPASVMGVALQDRSIEPECLRFLLAQGLNPCAVNPFGGRQIGTELLFWMGFRLTFEDGFPYRGASETIENIRELAAYPIPYDKRLYDEDWDPETLRSAYEGRKSMADAEQRQGDEAFVWTALSIFKYAQQGEDFWLVAAYDKALGSKLLGMYFAESERTKNPGVRFDAEKGCWLLTGSFVLDFEAGPVVFYYDDVPVIDPIYRRDHQTADAVPFGIKIELVGSRLCDVYLDWEMWDRIIRFDFDSGKSLLIRVDKDHVRTASVCRTPKIKERGPGRLPRNLRGWLEYDRKRCPEDYAPQEL
jgi:hypothetical protein